MNPNPVKSTFTDSDSGQHLEASVSRDSYIISKYITDLICEKAFNTAFELYIEKVLPLYI